jgi:hypothetical protein
MEKAVKKYDIVGLKAIVVNIAAAAECIDAVMADGKVDFKDLPKLPALLSVFKGFAGVSFKDVPSEALDLDAAEAQVLADLFAKEFDIANDNVEATIEKGLYLVKEILYAFASVKDVVDQVLKRGVYAPPA